MSKLRNVRLRFSLRSLLAFSSVACSLIGVLAFENSRMSLEREVIASLEKNHDALVTLSANPGEYPEPYWDWSRFSSGSLYRSADSVLLAESQVNEKCVSLLGALSQLAELHLQDCKLDVRAATLIATQLRLKSLVVDSCALSGNAAKELKSLSALKKLHLIDCNLTCKQIAAILGGAPGLHDCYLSDASITDSCLGNLGNCNSLQQLGLDTPNEIGDTIASLRNSSIEALSLAKTTLSVEMAADLCEYPKLNSLHFFRVKVEPQAKRVLQTINSRCNIQYIDCSPPLSKRDD